MNWGSVYNSLPDKQTSDYGIRIYKDSEICHVNSEKTRQGICVMILETDLHVNGLKVLTSGIYLGFSLCPIAETDCESNSKIKGFFFFVPFESWKFLDVYDLESLIHSSEFNPYHRSDEDEIKSVVGIMNLINMSLSSANHYWKTEELTYLCWALMAKLNKCYKNDRLSFQQVDSNHMKAR